MAAQPLSSLDPKAGYSFGIDILDRHPELASYIAQTISIGSIIERRWSAILVQLLQADPLTGMAMYQALTSTVAQRAALGAAAKVRLIPQDFELFQAVQTAITPARKLRNDFAHHLWGESALVPGGLVLIDPATIVDDEVSESAVHQILALKQQGPIVEGADRKRMKIYRKEDLLEAKGLVREAQVIVSDLWAALQFSDDEYSLHDEMRTKLRAHPRLVEVLRPPSQRSAPKAPRKRRGQTPSETG